MIAADVSRITARQAVQEPTEAKRAQYLFGPIADFLLLGGGSLIILPIAILLPASAKNAVFLITVALAFLVNNPHFAYSYQTFYRNFKGRASDGTYSRELRLRYTLSGLLVPAALAAFLLAVIADGNLTLLGAAGNAMAFFVGWHYVKQGYGMLIVQGALRRQYFGEREKRVILANSYAVWALMWIAANSTAKHAKLFGIQYYTLHLPETLVYIAAAVTILTTVATIYVVGQKWLSSKALPVTGIVAYCSALYLWLIVVRFDPIWALIVPALHSLQYLAVVWRFELNRDLAMPDAFEPSTRGMGKRFFKTIYRHRFADYWLKGIGLALLGFWVVPLTLDLTLPVGTATTGVFLFSFWVFINVHHYFIDNVIWRSENPEIKRYLFTEPKRQAEAEAI